MQTKIFNSVSVRESSKFNKKETLTSTLIRKRSVSKNMKLKFLNAIVILTLDVSL